MGFRNHWREEHDDCLINNRDEKDTEDIGLNQRSKIGLSKNDKEEIMNVLNSANLELSENFKETLAETIKHKDEEPIVYHQTNVDQRLDLARDTFAPYEPASLRPARRWREARRGCSLLRSRASWRGGLGRL